MIDDPYVVLNEHHPMRGFYQDQRPKPAPPSDDDLTVVNSWRTRDDHQVYVTRDANGKPGAIKRLCSPDQSMDRLNMWLTTVGAADAWDLDAEHRARDKLRGMLSVRQWRHYDLTGSFLETSPRSRLTYMFRRLRPTIVLTPRNRRGTEDVMRCLAVLCLHPVGYYQGSWGGCMVPSDDVIAHLVMMRADEAHYWGQANQHRLHSAEAGL